MSGPLQRLVWFLKQQLGIDGGRLLRAPFALPRYLRDYLRFRGGYAGELVFRPCLHDWREAAGHLDREYFLQDLYVARKVHDRAPRTHLDVGSRVDGFVAQVASFRQIEILDVRPMPFEVPGIAFRQVDLMRLDTAAECTDSLSCLHALEHFGLGRYGDPVDPHGHEAGLRNMARMVKPQGRLYLSVPVGNPRVEFNAHRVFAPQEIRRLAHEQGLELESFACVRDGRLEEGDAEALLAKVSGERYALGIYVFVKRVSA